MGHKGESTKGLLENLPIPRVQAATKSHHQHARRNTRGHLRYHQTIRRKRKDARVF